MKKIVEIIKTTFLGGLFFLLPLLLLIIIAEKGFKILEKIIAPIVTLLPEGAIFGFGFQRLASVIIVLLICFLAGAFARTRAAKFIISKIEVNILIHIPGYAFIKNMTENTLGVKSQELPVVMVLIDDAWQLAFQVEQVKENLFTVFVPDAPNPWSGGVYFIESERMRSVNITQKEAFRCLKRLGFGSAELLKGKV